MRLVVLVLFPFFSRSFFFFAFLFSLQACLSSHTSPWLRSELFSFFFLVFCFESSFLESWVDPRVKSEVRSSTFSEKQADLSIRGNSLTISTRLRVTYLRAESGDRSCLCRSWIHHICLLLNRLSYYLFLLLVPSVFFLLSRRAVLFLAYTFVFYVKIVYVKNDIQVCTRIPFPFFLSFRDCA